MATDTADPIGRQFHTQQVHYLRKRITYADDGVEVPVGYLPPRASVVGGGVHVVTGFDDTGNDYLQVGFKDGSSTDDADAYATNLDLSGVGFIALDELAATSNVQQTKGCLVTCQYDGANGNSAAGVADVIIMFVVDNDG